MGGEAGGGREMTNRIPSTEKRKEVKIWGLVRKPDPAMQASSPLTQIAELESWRGSGGGIREQKIQFDAGGGGKFRENNREDRTLGVRSISQGGLKRGSGSKTIGRDKSKTIIGLSRGRPCLRSKEGDDGW